MAITDMDFADDIALLTEQIGQAQGMLEILIDWVEFNIP